MTRAWLGLFSLTTRSRGEGKCLVKICEEPIVVGEQYLRITKGVKYKVSKTMHIRCVQGWMEFMASRRSRAPENKGGRPPIVIPEEHKAARRSLYRRLKYIVKKMEAVSELVSAEKLYNDYVQVLAAIDETGSPYRERTTPKRGFTLGQFKTNLLSWRKQAEIEDMPPLTSVQAPELSEERKAELDQQLKEILERVARGYVHIPEDEGGDYLA